MRSLLVLSFLFLLIPLSSALDSEASPYGLREAETIVEFAGNYTINVNDSVYWDGHGYVSGAVADIEVDPQWTANASAVAKMEGINVSNCSIYVAEDSNNVSFGTCDSNAPAEVSGSSVGGTGVLRVTNTNPGTRESIVMTRTASDGGLSFIMDNTPASNGRKFEFFTTDDGNAEGAGKFIIIDTTSYPYPARMTIDSSGNTMFGGTSPSVFFEVAGAGKFTGDFAIGTTSVSDAVLDFNGADAQGRITWKSEDLEFLVADDIKMAPGQSIRFRDDGIVVGSNDDGHLDLTADTRIDLNKDTYVTGDVTVTADHYFAGTGTHKIKGLTSGINIDWTRWTGAIDETWIYFKSDGNIGINSSNPSYPLDVNGNVSSISIYALANISADGYIERTSVYDKSMGDALDYVQDAYYYLDNGEINHTKFYGYAGEFTSTDYSRPELEEYNCTKEMINIKSKETYYIEDLCNRTVYPHTRIEEGVSLSQEVDVLRQAIYELKQRVEELEENCSAKPTP